MFLGFGLGDGGGGIDACVEGVAADGDGWVEGFGVEVLEVHGVITPGHGIRPCRFAQEDLDVWLRRGGAAKGPRPLL